MIRHAFLGCIAFILIGCAASPPLSELSVTRPAVAGPIFGSTMKPGTPDAAYMQQHGYTEEEFFISGKANLYRYGADGKPEVAQSGIQYTTRILIIRPADAAKFSGRAIIEPYHPGAAAISWAGMRDFTVRNGDIYVGVFVGGAGSRNSAQMRAMATAMEEGARRGFRPRRWRLPADGKILSAVCVPRRRNATHR